MRANLIGLSILLAITAAALLRAEPARCENCFSGSICFSDLACGVGNCQCLRINGLAKPGVCG